MNISHSLGDSNTTILVAIQGTNQSKYLQPDYFLFNSNNSYIGKKYDKIQQRISRIVSTALLSGLVLTASVDTSASSNTQVPVLPYMQDDGTYDHFTHEHTFEDVVKKKSLVRRAAHKVAKRLGFSNSSLKPSVQGTRVFDQPHSSSQSDSLNQPSISYNEVNAAYATEYGESIDEAMSKQVERNETLADILRRTLDIREREIKKREFTNTLDTFSDTASVSSSSGISEISSDSNSGNSDSVADEHMRHDVAATIKAQKELVEAASSYINTLNPQELEIMTRNARSYRLENTINYVDQTYNTSSSGYSGSDTASYGDISSPDAGSINESFNFTPSSDEPEYSDTAQDEFNNIHDTILTDIPNETFTTSHSTTSYEWDTEWDDSDDSDDDTSSLYSEATNVEEYDTVYTSQSEYSDTDSEYPNSDSEYDLSSEQVSSNEFEIIEEGGNFDTAVTRTQENAPVTTVVLDESNELQVSEVQVNITDESEVSAPVDQANHNTLFAVAETELAISDTANDLANADLGIAEDIENDNTDITEQQVISPSTTQTSSLDQETLLKKAEALSYISHNELHTARKVASNHIKQRMFERNMLAPVAAGDESESDHSQILGYSVWSSGALGTAKQKTSNSSNGYSSKIFGGSIGADVNFENDLLIGASFSKISSNIKHTTQSAPKKLNTYIASLYGSSPIKENLTLGVIGSAGFSPKPRSKLLSLESHLDYQIALPQEIKLIPNIGFKYEYERSKTYQEQIDSNVSIAHAKKSYQALSTEIGSRVIFAPIKFTDSCISTMSITPTAHISVERRIGSQGASNQLAVTYQELGQTIWAGSLPANSKAAKTSFNAGIGLIASHKNIKLELLYDHTRQKRFKAHQGMLKLKVSL